MKGQAGIIGAAVIVILVVVFALAGTGQFSTVGMTVMSLDQVTYTEGDQLGKVFVLNFKAEGLSQYVTGYTTNYVSGDRISAGDVQASKGLRVDVASATSSCYYDIGHDINAPPVIPLGKQKYYCDWWGVVCPSVTDVVAQCEGLGNPLYVITVPSNEKWCIYEVARHEKGTISDVADEDITTQVTMTVDGHAPITETFNKADRVKSFGSLGRVEYTGNLDYGDNCPRPSTHDVMPLWFNGGWTFVSEGAYETYKSWVVPRRASDWANTVSWTDTSVTTFVDEWNALASDTLRYEAFVSDGGRYAQASGTIEDGKAVIHMEGLISLPTFTAYIKADELGIVQPIGSPRITHTGNCYLPSGSTDETAMVSVRNVGTGRGNALVNLFCNDYISQVSSQTLPLDPGETGSVWIGLRGQSSTAETTDCYVEACILEDCDTEPLTCTVDPLCECEAGRQYCDDDIIYGCEADCKGWNMLQDCKDADQVCKPNLYGGTYFCADPEDGGDDGDGRNLACNAICDDTPIFGLIPNVPCYVGCWWETYSMAVYIIVGLIALIVILIAVLWLVK